MEGKEGSEEAGTAQEKGKRCAAPRREGLYPGPRGARLDEARR